MNIVETIEKKEASLAKKSNQLQSFIGNTPLFPITHFDIPDGVQLFAKLEWQQFGNSVKARPAYRIIDNAIRYGDLTTDRHLLDASSGNTGIAYAHIGAALGISVTLCLPKNASPERKQILKALGVDLRLTNPGGSTDKAQEVAQSMYENQPEKYFYADQYSNPGNWQAHYNTTGPEILEQTDYQITHFIAGLGTTGTFTGTGRRLKQYDHNIRLIGLQPNIAMHGLEGWKHLETAHVPDIYDDTVPDEIRTVSTDNAYDLVKQAARREGLLISPSAGANLAAALQLAHELEEGTIVTVFADDGSKYGEVINQLF